MSLILKNMPVLEEALHTYEVFLARNAFDHGGWWTVLAWVAEVEDWKIEARGR